jgi:hypothetical protein
MLKDHLQPLTRVPVQCRTFASLHSHFSKTYPSDRTMKGLLCITSLTFIAAAAAAGEALVQAIDDVKASCTATNVYAKSITGDSADAGIEGSQAWVCNSEPLLLWLLAYFFSS